MVAKMLQAPLRRLPVGRGIVSIECQPVEGPTPLHGIPENREIPVEGRRANQGDGPVGVEILDARRSDFPQVVAGRGPTRSRNVDETPGPGRDMVVVAVKTNFPVLEKRLPNRSPPTIHSPAKPLADAGIAGLREGVLASSLQGPPDGRLKNFRPLLDEVPLPGG